MEAIEVVGRVGDQVIVRVRDEAGLNHLSSPSLSESFVAESDK